MVALSVMGSAILLFSCEREEAEDAAASEETMRTEYSENLSIVESKNGRRSYHFVTPLVEGYSLAREPYREFRKGVKITTYKDDSLSTVDAVLTANYAIYYENRKLWEAKGNVVVVKSDGKNLYTQQLFWNQPDQEDLFECRFENRAERRTRRTYQAKVSNPTRSSRSWRFRRIKGRMEVEVKPTEQEVEVVPDSTAGGRTGASGPVPAQQSGKTAACIRRRAYARTRCQARRRSGSGPAARSQGCARQTGVRREACRSPAQNGTAADEAGGSETGR